MNYLFEREIAPNVWLRFSLNEYLKITVGDEVVLNVVNYTDDDPYCSNGMQIDSGSLYDDYCEYAQQNFRRKQLILQQIQKYAKTLEETGKKEYGFINKEMRRKDLKPSKRHTDPEEQHRLFRIVKRELREKYESSIASVKCVEDHKRWYESGRFPYQNPETCDAKYTKFLNNKYRKPKPFTTEP